MLIVTYNKKPDTCCKLHNRQSNLLLSHVTQAVG